jgi:molybdenum cofactor biosynthesis enzyme MoaA
MRKKSCARLIEKHLCYGSGAQYKFSQLQLPIISNYNVGCNYCPPRHIVSSSLPAVKTVKEAISTIRAATQNDPRLRIVSIPGPGEPLTNEVTTKTLQLIAEEFPYSHDASQPTGYCYPKKSKHYKKAGVAAITMTITLLTLMLAQKFTPTSA